MTNKQPTLMARALAAIFGVAISALARLAQRDMDRVMHRYATGHYTFGVTPNRIFCDDCLDSIQRPDCDKPESLLAAIAAWNHRCPNKTF